MLKCLNILEAAVPDDAMPNLMELCCFVVLSGMFYYYYYLSLYFFIPADNKPNDGLCGVTYFHCSYNGICQQNFFALAI